MSESRSITVIIDDEKFVFPGNYDKQFVFNFLMGCGDEWWSEKKIITLIPVLIKKLGYTADEIYNYLPREKLTNRVARRPFGVLLKEGLSSSQIVDWRCLGIISNNDELAKATNINRTLDYLVRKNKLDGEANAVFEVFSGYQLCNELYDCGGLDILEKHGLSPEKKFECFDVY